MPARPRRGALGLRGRIVGAVLVTAVATLVVAAVAVLLPLDRSLTRAERKTLSADLRGSQRAFRGIDLLDVSTNRPTRIAVEYQRELLVAKLDASVILLGYPDQTGQGVPQETRAEAADPIGGDTFDDGTAAFQSQKDNFTLASSGGTEYARAAIWFEQHGHPWVLAVRKEISDIPGAVHAVRTAFLYAALAGLTLTVILGIPLAGTLVRRLRRLRQAALQLAVGGPVEVPVDRARDEVGDLARTFEIMQRRLQQQEEARRAFVATASHELRTPLTSLDGMLELLDEDLTDAEPDLEDARALLERARAQSRRLGRLAADLLDLSRIDAAVALRSEPVELGELSRAVLAEFELGTSERGITSELSDGTGPVWALGDPGSVARILRILLDNAVRASSRGSEIRVELHRGDAASLSVCDTGAGIPADERSLIFERFQRGSGTGGRAGFGLGLAIGRELAERMGGELVLDESYELGAKFTLTLPAAQAPEQEPLVTSRT